MTPVAGCSIFIRSCLFCHNCSIVRAVCLGDPFTVFRAQVAYPVEKIRRLEEHEDQLKNRLWDPSFGLRSNTLVMRIELWFSRQKGHKQIWKHHWDFMLLVLLLVRVMCRFDRDRRKIGVHWIEDNCRSHSSSSIYWSIVRLSLWHRLEYERRLDFGNKLGWMVVTDWRINGYKKEGPILTEDWMGYKFCFDSFILLDRRSSW